jgi:hypothetical protein
MSMLMPIIPEEHDGCEHSNAPGTCSSGRVGSSLCWLWLLIGLEVHGVVILLYDECDCDCVYMDPICGI